jgi:uncharacterized protein (DUF2235 family)
MNHIICLDGTGNELGDHNTNVVITYQVSLKNDLQQAFYAPGIGTGGFEYTEEDVGLKAKSDNATGYGLQKKVEDAYWYLMQTYQPGDKIFVFGFSRGAFTARALAGMLYKVGLLRVNHDDLIPYASKIYNTDQNALIAAEFKDTFSRSCPVYFIGVWDTVESLIMTAGKLFYNYQLNSEVTYGYHALAIDERRGDFKPCLWDESIKNPNQTIEQVWFPGVHSDVGGWYDERDLSNIALNWMITKAKQCGMMSINMNNFPENPLGVMHESHDGIWILRPTYNRVIPENSKIHQSVIDRMAGSSYKPKLPINYTVVI